MDHYLDLRPRPDPEFPAAHLMSALFAKLHRALVALPDVNIGVSFPDVDEHCPSLGERLRLHGSRAALEGLMQQSWLQGMRDHLGLGEISPVPANAQYRQVSRVQTKSSPERLRRRQMRRHPELSEAEVRQAALQRLRDRHEELSEEEANSRIDRGQRLTLPFIPLRSQSTGQPFRLFIRHGPLQSKPKFGNFNRYGLSNGPTVPWF
ncbi:MAG: type I-F CRISPR-associated endoribonuclease Cas6/Csy4 [Zoogloeaceae bacterium]|jgi:CRISPR-associated endonuclease Csy4|nr:type I-F CRISPR-associated endoribonuclease Cas6/Csy4 [Zoogloeaceae bacterium]